jgi:hypothetical protein
MTVVPGYDCADNRTADESNEEKAVVHRELLINHHARLVMRRVVGENSLPQRHNLAPVNCIGIRFNGHTVH